MIERYFRLVIGLVILSCTELSAVSSFAQMQNGLKPRTLSDISTENSRSSIHQIAASTTVRILIENFTGNSSSGSGVIVHRQGDIYRVVTNWHVVSFADRYTIITPDGQQHYSLETAPKQIGENDLTVISFRSTQGYQVARMSNDPVNIGDRVFAVGFPMYHQDGKTETFDLGVRALRFTEGFISLLPAKPLYQGYRLGYSNSIVVGMSGGPIFNLAGDLIGINGRMKHRDPDFGGYVFNDGTEPSPLMLQSMISASWGIPISTYLNSQF